MAEYLAPGVYVEEVSFRSKSIEGVSTTTTGFVGPARYGPIDMVPDVITSLGEFELIHGDGKQLAFGSAQMDNFLWHAVRAFFEEGGKRLYISRAFRPQTGDYAAPKLTAADDDAAPVSGMYNDGHGRAWLSIPPSTTSTGSQTLPAATFNVADTAAFPTAGQFSVSGNLVTYTGKTATSFTGCTGGTGTVSAGAIAVGLLAPVTTSTGPQILPAMTFNVADTTAFPAAGEFSVNGNLVAYTGKTATSFTGCTGGTGTVPTGCSVLGWQPLSTTSTGAQSLPVATFNVADTAAFPAAGEFSVNGSIVTYTSKTATSFKGCTGGTGDIPADSIVVGVLSPLTASTGSQSLPVATFNIADTAAFPAAGEFSVNGNLVAYTGKTATSFTGCTGGTGSIPAGSSVLGWQPVSTASAGAQTLPAATFNVADTTSFPTTGQFSVNGNIVTYTGKTGTSFTGCTGGTGVISAGLFVLGFPPPPANEAERNATMLLRARFPGLAGNALVSFIFSLGQNALTPSLTKPVVRGILNGDVLLVSNNGVVDFYLAESFYDTVAQASSWRFRKTGDTVPTALKLADLTHTNDFVRVVNVKLTVSLDQGLGHTDVWDGLPLEPTHQSAGADDSIFARFGVAPANLSQSKTLPIVILKGDDLETGLDVLNVFFSFKPGLEASLKALHPAAVDVFLHGGNDGIRPELKEYEGKDDEASATKTGLKAFEDIDDISIVATPGSTFNQDGLDIANVLIGHCQRMRYRIAILDSRNGQTIQAVRAMRAQLDSTYAAFYYPWVRIMDPITRREVFMPPSGFVAGIYARNDINRAVYKAPANEVVTLALGFEITLNKSQQDVLNPEGINCFRYFPGRGYRLWGARTTSSDPEWKYVNLRRYFAYVEHSVDKGTQWAVFEPNGERLWDNVRRTIYDFLLNEWQNGALLGEKPEKAFFVRCDRSTMTQNDLDNGRLVCLIGIAPLRPAEYVIFRIGQWTADRKV